MPHFAIEGPMRVPRDALEGRAIHERGLKTGLAINVEELVVQDVADEGLVGGADTVLAKHAVRVPAAQPSLTLVVHCFEEALHERVLLSFGVKTTLLQGRLKLFKSLAA